MTHNALARYVAFSSDPDGGNPAGVWVGEALPSADEMQATAAEVGFPETVFAAPSADGGYDVRYFSPNDEVPFCGHATVALGARYATEHGPADMVLHTSVGDVAVEAQHDGQRPSAALVSVEPSSDEAPAVLVADALALLGWDREELDPSFTPVIAFGGARHLVIAAGTKARLDAVAYEMEPMANLMTANDLTTVNLIWFDDTDASVIWSRNLFPIGSMFEDPATGAAAAALGGYLRSSGRVAAPTSVTVRQGSQMGRPSEITVSIPVSGGIKVSGQAVALPDGHPVVL